MTQSALKLSRMVKMAEYKDLKVVTVIHPLILNTLHLTFSLFPTDDTGGSGTLLK